MPTVIETYTNMLKSRKILTRDVPTFVIIMVACAVIATRFTEENMSRMHLKLIKKADK